MPTRAMRILFVSGHRRFKIHFRAYPWAQALTAAGHSVDIMCHADKARWTTSVEHRNGFRIINNPDLLVGALRQGWDPVCALRRGWRLFREGCRYDLIHCLDTRPAVILPALAYARAKGIPIVSDWVDWWGRGGLIYERRPRWYQFLFGGFETFFEEYFRDKLDGLSVISSALLERAVGLGVPRERCLRIPGGANLLAFSNTPPKEECKARLNLAPQTPVLCFSGLDVLIDLELVLATFRRVVEAAPDAVLLLVGPPPDLIRKLAPDVDRILTTGPVPYTDLPRYLGAADIFLMPYTNKISNVGRWPNKVGDYMCIGRPTVSNPVGEVKWLFGQYGIGVLADETPISMAAATIALLRDPTTADEMGRRARRTAETVFAWDHLVADLEKWYTKLLTPFAPALVAPAPATELLDQFARELERSATAAPANARSSSSNLP